MKETILVTGGAGYIGSHTCRQLTDAGYAIVVLDNFYSGHRWAIPENATLVEGNIGDAKLVRETIRQHGIESVVHFAAHIEVAESVENPLKYYHNNIVASHHLIRTCADEGIKKFIYSSTAAVYGTPEECPIDEDVAEAPINPYGRTKLATEWMLRDTAEVNDLRYVALRYFNAAGSRVDTTLGQATPNATHLIKVACQVACGLRDSVTIFGTDYPTGDGTCIRDYIHVDDLASAHIAALAYLDSGGESQIFNCGNGAGYSVRQVLDSVNKVNGKDINIIEGPRREGDPAELVAKTERIRKVLDWTPQYDDLDVICESALNWERKYMAMEK